MRGLIFARKQTVHKERKTFSHEEGGMRMGTLKKFMAHVDMVKISCIDSTDIVEEARKLHDLNPTPTAALGRVLTMGTLMGTMMKSEEDRLTIQIMCNGPIGSILATANSKGEVKGYVGNPYAEAPLKENGKLNVSGIVGEGTLRIIKDIGIGEPYIGTVPLQTGEIAEDFAYYYATSEQIPTVVALGVLVNKDGSVKRAGGYILQALPDTPEEILLLIEKRIASSKSITEMLEDGMSLDEIATFISDDLNTHQVEEINVSWNCDCSKERMYRAIASMGKKDIEDLANDEKVEVVCHFCNSKYEFSKEEIQGILESKK